MPPCMIVMVDWWIGIWCVGAYGQMQDRSWNMVTEHHNIRAHINAHWQGMRAEWIFWIQIIPTKVKLAKIVNCISCKAARALTANSPDIRLRGVVFHVPNALLTRFLKLPEYDVQMLRGGWYQVQEASTTDARTNYSPGITYNDILSVPLWYSKTHNTVTARKSLPRLRVVIFYHKFGKVISVHVVMCLYIAPNHSHVRYCDNLHTQILQLYSSHTSPFSWEE